MRTLLRRHLPEYLIEAWGLGTFMLSACGFGILLFHPDGMAVRAIPDPLLRRGLMGIAMGLTAIGIVYSPWGKRSGGHLNPAMTLTFFRLGKVAPADAVAYTVAQFAGGVLGVLVSVAAFGAWLRHPQVDYVTTLPGPWGLTAAFAGELAISFGLMLAVLWLTNAPKAAPYTGLVAGALIALYITFEAPVSGMSMNPARSLGSALFAGRYDGLWIYFLAPPLGMLAASEVYVRWRGRAAVSCAKLRHTHDQPCLFCEHHVRPMINRRAPPLPPRRHSSLADA